MNELFRKTILQLYGEDGRVWLTNLSNLLLNLEKNWNIKIIEPVAQLNYNYVLKVSLAGYGKAILKCSVPNREFNIS